MKIAIPILGSRVSPRFDFSPEVWIIDVERGEVVGKKSSQRLISISPSVWSRSPQTGWIRSSAAELMVFVRINLKVGALTLFKTSWEMPRSSLIVL